MTAASDTSAAGGVDGDDPIARLLDIMRRLRDPASGCPWDREQTSASIARYAIEEAFEVVDAIETGDDDALKAELGDLLFQVVFHAQLAAERGAFDFPEVASAIGEKMIARHPHVFDGASYAKAEEQERAWETIKAQERAAKAQASGAPAPSALDDIPAAFPALMRAQKLAKRAARVGFDYPDAPAARDKVLEELDEVMAARETGDAAHLAEEIGDLLFSATCLAMKLDVHAEDALRAANAKFERRFRAMERQATVNGQTLSQLSLAQLDVLWDAAKQCERDRAGQEASQQYVAHGARDRVGTIEE